IEAWIDRVCDCCSCRCSIDATRSMLGQCSSRKSAQMPTRIGVSLSQLVKKWPIPASVSSFSRAQLGEEFEMLPGDNRPGIGRHGALTAAACEVCPPIPIGQQLLDRAHPPLAVVFPNGQPRVG